MTDGPWDPKPTVSVTFLGTVNKHLIGKQLKKKGIFLCSHGLGGHSSSQWEGTVVDSSKSAAADSSCASLSVDWEAERRLDIKP